MRLRTMARARTRIIKKRRMERKTVMIKEKGMGK